MPTGTSESICNGVDDDCDSSIDEDYAADTSCFLPGACSAGNVASSCTAGSETACQTGTPAASDATCNGTDDDCDGTADEDYVSSPTNCGVGACAETGSTSCVSGAVVDSCSPGTPAASDATCNGTDDDCDGTADEDYSPTSNSCGTGVCASTGTPSSCSGGLETPAGACTPGTPTSEICDNGIDEDCNGSDSACGNVCTIGSPVVATPAPSPSNVIPIKIGRASCRERV